MDDQASDVAWHVVLVALLGGDKKSRPIENWPGS
jgi:hypothetical protein